MIRTERNCVNHGANWGDLLHRIGQLGQLTLSFTFGANQLGVFER